MFRQLSYCVELRSRMLRRRGDVPSSTSTSTRHHGVCSAGAEMCRPEHHQRVFPRSMLRRCGDVPLAYKPIISSFQDAPQVRRCAAQKCSGIHAFAVCSAGAEMCRVKLFGRLSDVVCSAGAEMFRM